MKKILSLLLLVFSFHQSFSQDLRFTDSLRRELRKFNAVKKETGRNAPDIYDTTAANLLFALSKAYWSSSPDTAMDYAGQCLELSEQIGYKKGMGNANYSIGVNNWNIGNYLPALECFKKSLKLAEETGNQQGIATANNGIGNIYLQLGNYPQALKSYLEGLKIREEAGDDVGIAACYNNIGVIYEKQGNYALALKNHLAALKIRNETGDKKGIASSNINIGNIYKDRGNYPEALKHHSAALKISDETGDKKGIADAFNNLGNIYELQRNYTQAIKSQFAGLKIREEMGDKYGITITFINIGSIYILQKKFNEAAGCFEKSLALSKEIGSLEGIKLSYQTYAQLDSVRGNLGGELEHYKLYIAYRDSLVNNENIKKTVQMQMQYDFDKKESSTKAEQEKKDATSHKEVQKQKLVRNGFIGGTVLFLLLAGAIFIGLRRMASAKKKSEELLLNILPAAVATELKQTGQCQPKTFSMVTVMFADFKDFTKVSERVSAELLVSEINYCFSAFDNILEQHKIEKIKTVGDAYLCASGLPTLNYTHAFDMVTAALEMKNFIHSRRKEKEAKGETGFQVRIGIHTGPVVAGIVGIKKFSYDIWGDTVNLAARMEQSCDPGNVNISGNTYELVKDKFTCIHRGKVHAKHKGEVDMYFVERKL